MNPEHDSLMTLKEVAEVLNVRDRRTVRRHLAAADVPLITVGRSLRVRHSDLEAMLSDNVRRQPAELPARGNGNGRVDASSNGNGSRPRCRSRASAGSGSRRGWREKVETGLYKSHRVSCSASKTKTSRADCDCLWQVHVTTGQAGRTKLKSFAAPNITAARREKQRLQAPPANPAAGNGDVTLSAFFRGPYLANKILTQSTKVTYTQVFEADIEPYLGRKRLSDITAEDVDGWLLRVDEDAVRRRRSSGKRRPKFVLGRLRVLSAILSTAARWRRISFNPALEARLPDCDPLQPDETELETGAKKILTPDQLEVLFTEVRRDHRRPLFFEALYRVTLELGLRCGELRGLRLSDLDFEAQQVEILRQVSSLDSVERVTKGKRKRTLPLSSIAIDLIERLLHQQELDGNANPSRYLFGLEPGAPLGRTTANDNLVAFQRQAGLVDGNERPLISLHGLRHTCATLLLVDRGLNIPTVSRYLGHAGIEVTLRNYAHLFEDETYEQVTDYWATAIGQISPTLF